jgi:L,D-transpeptidase ErfK/SrfK
MKSAVVIFFLLSIHFPVYAAVITGGETVYRVAEGDSLLLISAKFGVDMGLITRKNNLNPAKPLHPGQELRLDTRKIAPQTVENGIIVDIPGRMIYYFKKGNSKYSFPSGSACRSGGP